MKISEVIKYYSRKDVQKHILNLAKNREIAISYNGKFAQRPQTLLFERDIIEHARNGATSFHASEERWNNPMSLVTTSKKNELDRIRIGWDLILDIDCKFLEYSKICAKLIIETLKFHGVNCYSIKFSGNTGFHIGVPFEAFPNKINETEVSKMFPEAPQVIANYIKEMIKERLGEEILKFNNLSEIMKKTGMKYENLIIEEDDKKFFNPYSLITIDTIAISSRHLFRMPYSLNEKSWLVSVPIKEDEIDSFEKELANVNNICTDIEFLSTKNVSKNEAKQLFIEAYDWASRIVKEEIVRSGKIELPENAIPIQCFPPCIKSILKGLSDGRKRSVFILINFLKGAGWEWEKIEREIKEWNLRNPEPLRESYINSQLRWHKKIKQTYTPPNCSNSNYYKDIGVCSPDSFCSNIKNPLVYAIKRYRKIDKSK